MDFNLPQQTLDIIDLCNDLGKNVIEPFVPRCEAGEYPVEPVKALANAGLLGMVVPQEYGGPGCSYLDLAMAMETLGRYSAGISGLLNLSNNNLMLPIMRYGTEEQKQLWMPRIATGEAMCAFALTEPDAGSDNAGMKTRAVADGDDYIINGMKCFISDAEMSNMFLVMTVTSAPDAPKKEFTAFMLDYKLYGKGISFGKAESTMGLRGFKVNDVFFDDVRVPKSCMLGNLGDGFKVAMTGLNPGRCCAASLAIGMARRVLDDTVEYTKQRKMFGKTLSAMQNTQFVLADCKCKLDSVELMVLKAISMLDEGKEDPILCCETKYLATEYAKETIDKCLQFHGGYGYVNEYTVERMYRDIRIATIAEGASEVCKYVIARGMGLR